MGLQFAGVFGERLGGCCLLPEMEPRQGLVNPTAVVAAPWQGRAVARGVSETCENTRRLYEPWKGICKHCEQMVSPHGGGRISELRFLTEDHGNWWFTESSINPLWGKVFHYNVTWLVSFTLSQSWLLNLNNHNLDRNKLVHLTLVKKKNRYGTSVGNRVAIHPGPLDFRRCLPEPSLHHYSLQPWLQENLHLKLRHMDGGTTLKASGSSDFMIFCKLYSLSFPIILLIKGCFSIHGIFFCWNLNLFPVLLMLTHLRITWSLLKGYLFSPLWDPGSVFTHFISEWLISSGQAKYSLSISLRSIS